MDQTGHYLLDSATQDSKLDQIEQLNLGLGTALARKPEKAAVVIIMMVMVVVVVRVVVVVEVMVGEGG